MRTVKEFLLEKGILPAEDVRRPYAIITDENRHFVEPAEDPCESCTILGIVREDFQGKYVQEILVLFGSLIEAVAKSQPIGTSRGFLARASHELQSRVESDLGISPGVTWSLRKGFQAVTHLKYPPVTAKRCWNEVFFSALNGPLNSPFIESAHILAFNRDSELNEFLFG